MMAIFMIYVLSVFVFPLLKELELKAVQLVVFPQTLAPQQQLVSSCRNFLKEKQRDDISVSGENIINNKQ